MIASRVIRLVKLNIVIAAYISCSAKWSLLPCRFTSPTVYFKSRKLDSIPQRKWYSARISSNVNVLGREVAIVFPLVFQPPDKKERQNKPKVGGMIDVLVRNYYVLLTSYFLFILLTINLMCTSKISDFSLLRKTLVATVTISIVYKILFFKSLTLILQKFHNFPQ